MSKRGPKPKGNIHVNFNRIVCLERDNYTCQICGSKTNILQVHHKDDKGPHISGGKVNHNLDNLETLCIKCHHKLHWNSIERDKEIVYRHHIKGETLSNIARSLGISRQRAYQIYLREKTP
jgi:5-methylcytosine-specific restriction endonuclease McrA